MDTPPDSPASSSAAPVPAGETEALHLETHSPHKSKKGHRRNKSDGDALAQAMQAASAVSPPSAVRTSNADMIPPRPSSPPPRLPSPNEVSPRPAPVIGASRLSNRGNASVTFTEPPQIVRTASPPPAAPPPVQLPADLPRLEEVKFDEKDSESNIQYEENADAHAHTQARAMSVGKLLEKMTAGEAPEELASLVVCTHLTWIPAVPFIALLQQRYKQTTDLRVHAQVVDALRVWVEHVFDATALPSVQAFVKSIEATHSTVMGHGSLAVLQRAIESAVAGKRAERRAASLSPRGGGIGIPLLRRSPAVPTLCAAVEDVPAVDLAKQMSLLDEQLFTLLTERELCNVAWTRANKETAAPNVMAIITRFNRIVSWTQWTVLRSEKPEGRARTIRYLIKAARRLFEMHNYAGMYALVSGLQGVAVKRLQLTWALIKKHRAEKLTHLVDFMKLDQQYANYREYLSRLAPHIPCVPYVGPYLGQLTFVEEMPRLVHGFVNVSRLRAVHSSIQAVLRFQTHPAYSFDVVPWLQSMVNEGTLFTESQLYKQSLKCEPRLSMGGQSTRGHHGAK